LQRPGNAMKMTLQLASFFLLAGLLAVHGKTKYINKLSKCLDLNLSSRQID